MICRFHNRFFDSNKIRPLNRANRICTFVQTDTAHETINSHRNHVFGIPQNVFFGNRIDAFFAPFRFILRGERPHLSDEFSVEICKIHIVNFAQIQFNTLPFTCCFEARRNRYFYAIPRINILFLTCNRPTFTDKFGVPRRGIEGRICPFWIVAYFEFPFTRQRNGLCLCGIYQNGQA